MKLKDLCDYLRLQGLSLEDALDTNLVVASGDPTFALPLAHFGYEPGRFLVLIPEWNGRKVYHSPELQESCRQQPAVSSDPNFKC